MTLSSTSFIKAALSAIHYSGADRIARPFTGGAGVIFMLHHVSPEPPKAFEPNSILKITPGFLDQVLHLVVASGYEPISMDEVPERLKRKDGPPFVCFTFDDGYRDNRDHALPVFKKHGVPLTIYVPSAFADGKGDLWWLNLEAAIAELDEVRLNMSGEWRLFKTRDPNEKLAAFTSIYWWLRSIDEDDARSVVRRLAEVAGLDIYDSCRRLVMNWDELRALSNEPLVTIGAHTTHHYSLAKLSSARAHNEISESVSRIETELNRPCRHFSYPYGSDCSAGPREFAIAKRLGLATAVTTRKGLIGARDKAQVTALPRLSLNGDFQQARYIKALLSGVPFALRDAVKARLPADEASYGIGPLKVGQGVASTLR